MLRRLRTVLRARPFGHYICTAVNDAVLHGRPYDYALADGDLLTLDLAVSLGGVAADAISFIVGDARPAQSVELIEVTERAPAAGIAAARPGARTGDLSHAIGTVLRGAGYPVNTQFGGHGIGSTMHQDPHIPNAGRPGRGYTLRPGLLLALEPWVMADASHLVTDADGWNPAERDGLPYRTQRAHDGPHRRRRLDPHPAPADTTVRWRPTGSRCGSVPRANEPSTASGTETSATGSSSTWPIWTPRRTPGKEAINKTRCFHRL